MCGLAGAVFFQASCEQKVADDAVRQMCDRMIARGPDASGFWNDASARVSLGLRRLAIIDLDARANQPMVSDDERYVIVFNGEIYNFRALRRELETLGEVFRTQSDTEVLLKLYARQGEAMLPRLRGMFAFAVWDRAKRQLFVARDPYGIKPLYIAKTAFGVLIASQVKALLATNLVSREVDQLGQAGFWLLGSVPEPRTWFRDIQALRAGHFAIINAAGIGPATSWWDIGREWRNADFKNSGDEDVRASVRSAVRRSVEAHLVSDVPIGIFLSGGIDSGALAALMVESGITNLHGVTLAFREFSGRSENEVPWADRLAKQLRLTHHIRVVSSHEFESDIPQILNAMDQPTVDGVNTWYASKAAKELGLKVVLSGVGGDELFQGYSTFRQLPKLVALWRGASRMPGFARLAEAVCAWQGRHSGNSRWNDLPALLGSIDGAWFLRRGLFGMSDIQRLMGGLGTLNMIEKIQPHEIVREATGMLPNDSSLALSQIESMTYLRNQLLRDSDWASMSHSVELRAPLVDAWLLRDLSPHLNQFRLYGNKRLLADAPRTSLPRGLIRRGKTGFGIPTAMWLGLKSPRFLGHSHSSHIARFVSQACYGI